MGSRLEKNSTDVRKRIEGHTFDDEDGEEYSASKFGGFTDYMRRKKIKLQNLDAELRSQSTENPPIFRGIVAHVNGYTQPSLADLHKLIVSYGGGFLQYLDGKTAVTHVIASNLTQKKKVEFARYRIVKPAWVVDSVNAGKLLSWENYRGVDEGVKQKVLSMRDGQITSQANIQRQSYKEQTDTSWYTYQMRSVAPSLDAKHMYDAESSIEYMEDVAEDEPFMSKNEIPKSYIDANEPSGPTEPARDKLFDLDDAFSDDDFADEAGVIGGAENCEIVHQQSAESISVSDGADTVHATRNDQDTGMEAASHSPANRLLTAEEHNAVLLSNPHLAKSSTANPDFLNQYYRESRLHHLSIWKADLRAQLQRRALEKSSSQMRRLKRPAGARRYIMHVDFDSFFAAVSLRKNPELTDTPVVIAHGSGPGSEIASCNYPARVFGIKNGMWMKTALQLCSYIKVLPYDFKAYEEASRQFYESILAIDGVVQSISIDEALVDVSIQCIEAGGTDGKGMSEDSIQREQAKANQLAATLRALVKEKTGCNVSVGIGNNILLAKVALRKAKPAGQHLIKPEEVLDFIGELTVTDLPGVAYSIGGKLEEIGIKHVKDIRTITKERLINTLGPKTGEKLWDYSRGIDKVEVGEQIIRKSVSAEINWGIRFVTQQQAEEFVQSLCDELHKRLLEQMVKGKQLTMKIMKRAADAGMDPPKNLGHGKCDTFNKSVILGVATNDQGVLGKEAISILRGYGFSPGELRGLGVQMQKLEPLKKTPESAFPSYDSSQRRLQFKKPGNTPITDRSPLTTSRPTGSHQVSTPQKSSRLKDELDSIEDVPTPKKPNSSKVIIGALDHNKLQESRQKPLNISGTQFILPTQIDPSVLAELPADIRSKFAPRNAVDVIARPKPPVELQDSMSRSASPLSGQYDQMLPNESQLDPEILDALPEDVRKEVLAQYASGGSKWSHRRNQQVLPQSPRKARPVLTSKKLATTPTKKQKTVNRLVHTKPSKTHGGGDSTLTQSNFVNYAKADSESKSEGEGEIPQSFLEELPEDIRAEVLAEQKRNRIAKAGLQIATVRKKAKAVVDAEYVPWGERRLLLPPRDPVPTFTSKKLSTLAELRDAMSAWVREFSDEGEEGPFDEDVAALITYLGKVVNVELDMEKAVSVVEWVAYLVSDRNLPEGRLREEWEKAVDRLRSGVQEAVKHRGLPPVAFSDP